VSSFAELAIFHRDLNSFSMTAIDRTRENLWRSLGACGLKSANQNIIEFPAQLQTFIVEVHFDRRAKFFRL
jgi:hypothetical protein